MALILNGIEYPCNTPVVDWRTHGLTFKPGKGARKRDVKKTDIDLMVWHWTGGESTHQGLFSILENRNLGVEFSIDREGTIWQFCDPVLVDTWDAGTVNPRSMGVEIANYGEPLSGGVIPKKGQDREVYECRLHGKDRKFARFYKPQIQSALDLANAISLAYPDIPRVVPKDANGDLLKRTMTDSELKSFKGHLGHYHVTNNKKDPGFDLLEAFIKDGF